MKTGIKHDRVQSVRRWAYVGVMSLAIGLCARGTVAGEDAHSRSPISASTAIEMLREGNLRFAGGSAQHPNTSPERIRETGSGQRPFAVVLGCADSRVAPERVFDRGVGDLFVVRVAGNVASQNVLGSLEYATRDLGANLIVVMGHDKCGAVGAACTNQDVGGATKSVVNLIEPAVKTAHTKHPEAEGAGLVKFAVEENVWQSMRSLVGASADLQALVKSRTVRVVGAVYDVDTGSVRFMGEDPEMDAVLAAGVKELPGASGGSVIADALAPAKAHDAPSEKTEKADKTEKQAVAEANEASDEQASATDTRAKDENAKVTSTGSFQKPALALPALAPFGLDSAKDDAKEAAEKPAASKSLAVWGFAGLTGALLVTTLLAGLMLSRTTDAAGVRRRTFTLGSKLSLAMGGLATLLMGACLVGVVSQNALKKSSDTALAIKNTSQLVEQLQTEMMRTRMAARTYTLNPTKTNLDKFTAGVTSARTVLNTGRASIDDAEVSKLFDQAGELLVQYDRSFREMVEKSTRLRAVLNSQYLPAGDRTIALLDQMGKSAVAAGDARAAVLSADVRRQILLSRSAMFEGMALADRMSLENSTKAVAAAVEGLVALGARTKGAERKAMLVETREALDFLDDVVQEIVALQIEQEKTVAEKLDKLGPQIAETGKQLSKTLDARENVVTAGIASTERQATINLALFALAALFVSGVTVTILVRSITTSLGRVVRVLGAVAEGDLMQQPINSTSKDELGELARSTDRMAAKLRDVITEVRISTTEVSSAATEIASSAEEMSASVSEVARQAAQAVESAGNSGRIATEGGEVVRKTVSGMQEINGAVSASAQSVEKLGERGQQIGRVIAVINDIADQTNLLALNAAIEAARAGEHGRGFAVVADEVRKLAERTTKATEEVAESIKAIQDDTKQAVQRMSRGTEEVRSGVELAGKAGENLEQIVSGAQQVAGMIQAISAASDQAGAGASQSASAAVELSAKAEQLLTLVSRFKLDVGEGSSGKSLARAGSPN